ncbi:hypothetical protein [Streptomyces rhizosphaericus]|uniref:hypothetical protein n=1 Tax=Streptomyces rhizosphaericus TaxID=114699 RepID=UPI000A372C09|nr:hypothetical protein [Streptomyces rhizosphaericus]
MEDSSAERRAAHARWRVQWWTETALNAVMSDPAVQRLKEEVDQLEVSFAQELSPQAPVLAGAVRPCGEGW